MTSVASAAGSWQGAVVPLLPMYARGHGCDVQLLSCRCTLGK